MKPSLRAAANLAIGSLDETGFPPYNLLHSLSGRHTQGVDCLTLLAFDEEGIVSVLHFLF